MRTFEERDLVTRRAHETDARAMRVALTVAGRVLVDQATGLAREVDTMFFGADPAPQRGIADHRARPGVSVRSDTVERRCLPRHGTTPSVSRGTSVS